MSNKDFDEFFDSLTHEQIAAGLIEIRDDHHWSSMSNETAILTQAARRLRKFAELEPGVKFPKEGRPSSPEVKE